MKKYGPLILAAILLGGCGTNELTGNAYLKRPDGVVIPAAAQPIHLINQASASHLFSDAFGRLNSIANPDIKREKLSDAILSDLKSAQLKVVADIGGKFVFPDVAEGSYLMYAEYSNSLRSGIWMHPMTVKESVTVELNPSNFLPVDFITYYYLKVSEACWQCSKAQFRSSLLSDDEVLQRYTEVIPKQILELNARLGLIQKFSSVWEEIGIKSSTALVQSEFKAKDKYAEEMANINKSVSEFELMVDQFKHKYGAVLFSQYFEEQAESGAKTIEFLRKIGFVDS